MSRRSRIVGFGSAALLIVAGAVCTIVLSSGLAQDLALGVMGVGVVEAVSLVFLEVGFSEDRARAREEAARRREQETRPGSRPPARPARSRLERLRGRPRRLR